MLLGAGGVAAAQPLPNVPSMTCRQAQALVQSRGAIVLRTSPTTYDRFVSQDIYCEPDGYAAPAFEPALDNRECFIGYYCHEKEDNMR